MDAWGQARAQGLCGYPGPWGAAGQARLLGVGTELKCRGGREAGIATAPQRPWLEAAPVGHQDVCPAPGTPSP